MGHKIALTTIRVGEAVRKYGQVIGFAGLKYLDDLNAVDLGYRLLPEYWGQGLATEASRASIQYGFDTLELERILGLADPEHFKSIRVLEKLGFVYDKVIEYRSQPAAMYFLDADRATPYDSPAGKL